MVRVIDGVVYIAQADDVCLYIKPVFDDLRYEQQYVLTADDYFLVSIRYEASDYAPVLYETRTSSKMLKISSEETKKFPVGKYSLSIFLVRKLEDGTMFRQQIVPNFKYQKIPTGRETNFKNFIVNAISDYN